MRSKIDRLPMQIRDQIGAWMRDGKTDSEILPLVNSREDIRAHLAKMNYGGRPDRPTVPEISAANISDWRNTSFVQWQKDQDNAEQLGRLAETSYRMAAAAGEDPTSGACALLAGRILQALESADNDQLAVLVESLVALRGSDLKKMRVVIANKSLDQREKQLALARDRFNLTVAQNMLKVWSDSRAMEILNQPGTNEEKVGRLLDCMKKIQEEEDVEAGA